MRHPPCAFLASTHAPPWPPCLPWPPLHRRRSQRADGSEDAASIHAAEVVRRGEKWIATRWMKEAAGA
jgi:hypothetical protein